MLSNCVPGSSHSYLAGDALHGQLAQLYLTALMQGDRPAAGRAVHGALERGVSVPELYRYVFEPAQYEVGRLWETREINVAQEHYRTAATQMIMSELYPHIFTSQKSGRTLVSTCVSGDLHEIGLRMVTDLFEMAGWNTFYLGANTPADAVVETLVGRHADVLAISATIAHHQKQVVALIDAVRASAAARHVKILVGGYLFRANPELGHTIGADGVAVNAHDAMALADQLLA